VTDSANCCGKRLQDDQPVQQGISAPVKVIVLNGDCETIKGGYVPLAGAIKFVGQKKGLVKNYAWQAFKMQIIREDLST